MPDFGNPEMYWYGTGALVALVVALAIWMVRSRRRQIAAMRENAKKLSDYILPSVPIWSQITCFLLGMLTIACLVLAIYTSSAQEAYEPRTVRDTVKVPTTVGENGERYVLLTNGGSTLTYLCAPEECTGLRVGDDVFYTTYVNRDTQQRVNEGLQRS